MKKLTELLRLKRTWTAIGALLGVLGYSQYVPITTAIGESVAVTIEVQHVANNGSV